jgi:hypothetical protein
MTRNGLSCAGGRMVQLSREDECKHASKLANKVTGANSRPASPLDAGRQIGCASCAPPSPSAAVAQFGRWGNLWH